VGCAGEARAAADEEDSAGKEKGAAALPASVEHRAAGAAAVELEAPTQTADAFDRSDPPVAAAAPPPLENAIAVTVEAAASISKCT
jgi:hypothetical protein